MTCLLQISIILDFAALTSVEIERRRPSWGRINSGVDKMERIHLTSIVCVVAMASRTEKTTEESDKATRERGNGAKKVSETYLVQTLRQMMN